MLGSNRTLGAKVYPCYACVSIIICKSRLQGRLRLLRTNPTQCL